MFPRRVKFSTQSGNDYEFEDYYGHDEEDSISKLAAEGT